MKTGAGRNVTVGEVTKFVIRQTVRDNAKACGDIIKLTEKLPELLRRRLLRVVTAQNHTDISLARVDRPRDVPVELRKLLFRKPYFDFFISIHLLVVAPFSCEGFRGAAAPLRHAVLRRMGTKGNACYSCHRWQGISARVISPCRS